MLEKLMYVFVYQLLLQVPLSVTTVWR